MDEMQELLVEFIAEAQDILVRVQSALVSFKTPGNRLEHFKEIARGIHTIKGGAAMFNMSELADRAHKLESYLNKFKDNPEKMTDRQIDSVEKYLDVFHAMLEGSAQSKTDDLEDITQTTEAVVTQESTVESAEASSAAPMTKTPVPVDSTPAASARSANDLVRVPIDRIQKNIDTITEIFLIRNQMSFLVNALAKRLGGDETFMQEWDTLDNALRKGIGELEHIALGMRMMPVKNLFQRMEKTVRAYTETSKKSIHVKITGESTELDKKILDYLGEPLIHLIRNAMDHGIETADVRRKHNKPETGTIHLSAEVSGNEVFVRIEDDGKGINPTSVLESARNKGLDVSHVKTDDQAIDLIFLPGFSTAETVSEVSGRGVGLDAVKTFVESIGGSIQIKTVVNAGTTFLLTLPLGMSLIPAIIARINSEIYAISSNEVMESIRVTRKDILQNGEESFLKYKDKLIPCYFMDEHLSKDTSPIRLNIVNPRVSVCIVKNQSELLALCVTEFISNTEIATKPLPALAPKIPYVTGASILATGDPVFVLSLRRFYQSMIARKDPAEVKKYAAN